jgi:hypothetical protein
MSVRTTVAATALALAFATAGSPASAANITTNLGLINNYPGLTFFPFFEIVTYEPNGNLFGLLGWGYAETVIQGFTGACNYVTTTDALAPDPGVFDFTFFVSQPSTVQIGPGPDQGFGTESATLMIGSFVVGTLSGQSITILPGAVYTIELTGSANVPTQTPYGIYELQGRITPISGAGG